MVATVRSPDLYQIARWGLSVAQPAGFAKASRALTTILLRKTFSSSGEIAGSPRGLVMACPWIKRLAPMAWAVGNRAVTRTAGMPCLSISLSSTDPQRVPVPQVAVTRAASTLAFFNWLAIPSPIRLPLSRVVATPVVAK